MRKLLAVFLGVVAVLAVIAPSALAIPEETVVVKFFDQNGNGTKLTPVPGQSRDARRRSRGRRVGHRRPARPRKPAGRLRLPAVQANSNLRFDIPEGESVAFSAAWPTDSEGFSEVIVDNGGDGFANGGKAFVFNYEAAKDAKRRLDEALEARPSYEGSEAFESRLRRSANRTSAWPKKPEPTPNGANTASARSTRSALANDLMLSEYGPQYAHDHETKPWAGLTVDDPGAYSEWPGWPAK